MALRRVAWLCIVALKVEHGSSQDWVASAVSPVLDGTVSRHSVQLAEVVLVVSMSGRSSCVVLAGAIGIIGSLLASVVAG